MVKPGLRALLGVCGLMVGLSSASASPLITPMSETITRPSVEKAAGYTREQVERWERERRRNEYRRWKAANPYSAEQVARWERERRRNEYRRWKNAQP